MNNFILTNIDTDAVSFCRQDMSPFTKEERKFLIESLNTQFDDEIKFTDDGYFTKFIVLKCKNYIMVDEEGKKTIKGSSLKASTLEPALKAMLNEFIDALIDDKQDTLPSIYQKYIDMVDNITDIKPWCTKKTLSPTTYNSTRKNETDIIDATKGAEYRSGDRIYLYAKTKEIETGEMYKVGVRKGQMKTKMVKYYGLQENFDGIYDRQTYYDKIHTTIQRFATVIDTSIFKEKK